MKKSDFLRLLYASYFLVCISPNLSAQHFPTVGKVVSETPEFDKLIAKDAVIEVLASGFLWAEGPVWVNDRQSVFFTDVPKNTIYEWNQKSGLAVFLQPSGYTGTGIYSDEPGANGLIIDKSGNLVSCEHGDRRVSVMPLTKGGKRTLADNFEGKKLNSPNDVAQHPVTGLIYFTDPPYGLEKKENDPKRELDFCGVYRVNSNGKTELVIRDLSRPNGVAFSPDGKMLYIAVSDPEKAHIMAYPLASDGKVGKGEILYDATPLVKMGLPGLPDGLKTDSNGNIWSTGPGGVLVLSPKGKLLGRIETGRPTANCAWGDDGSTLYLTAHQYLCRIRTLAKGAGW